MREIFVPILDFEQNYEISRAGIVRNIKTKKILKQRKNNKGYCLVDLYKNNTRYQLLVHRLVALMFCKKSDNDTVVNHKDEVKDNNCFTNLEWCTQKYNMNYGGVKEKISIANSKKVKAIKNNNEIVFRSAMEAQRLLGISNGCINECLKGKRRTAGGYQWEYVK